jgi:peptidoglycan/xylan/chitin deacetylase (PgdA/CDA1 family)
LSHNGYHTLDADELYDHLVNGTSVPQKSVVLTFDDGRATFWTIAFPILQKYNLKAVCFLVPGTMQESGVRTNLSDYEAREAISLDELLNVDLSSTPAITWDEARLMYSSGLVDFQSHTLNHTLIYCAPEILDFVNPALLFQYSNYGMPVIRYNGTDCKHCRPPLGTPIYRMQPRLGAAKRFFDDEGLRIACVDFVERNGGETFFIQTTWRADLLRFVKKYRQENELRERFETEEEQIASILDSLTRSKQLIEERLPDHTVRHVCYPWHHYSILAACLAREAGYVSAFIDINPQKSFSGQNNNYYVERVLPVNGYGDDPYLITRIDARDNMVLSLPGKGRLSIKRRIAVKLLKSPRLFKE